jgi:hypothetical protein
MGCREEVGAPAAPWDSLCEDVKPAILSHLSVPDLARAALACRDFREACRGRLGAERQKIIALTEDTYNQALVRAFVGAVRQDMCESTRLLKGIDKFLSSAVIDMSGHFYPEVDTSFPFRKSLAVLHAQVRSPWWGAIPRPFMSLWGIMYHEKENCGWKDEQVNVYKSRNDVLVGLCVTADKAVPSAAVGLLLATCAGYSEDMPARWQTPAMVTLLLNDFPLGARGKKETACLIAPVRHLANSVVIEETETTTLGLMLSGAGPEFPLGHLRVRIVIPYRRTRRGIEDSWFLAVLERL